MGRLQVGDVALELPPDWRQAGLPEPGIAVAVAPQLDPRAVGTFTGNLVVTRAKAWPLQEWITRFVDPLAERLADFQLIDTGAHLMLGDDGLRVLATCTAENGQPVVLDQFVTLAGSDERDAVVVLTFTWPALAFDSTRAVLDSEHVHTLHRLAPGEQVADPVPQVQPGHQAPDQAPPAPASTSRPATVAVPAAVAPALRKAVDGHPVTDAERAALSRVGALDTRGLLREDLHRAMLTLDDERAHLFLGVTGPSEHYEHEIALGDRQSVVVRYRPDDGVEMTPTFADRLPALLVGLAQVGPRPSVVGPPVATPTAAHEALRSGDPADRQAGAQALARALAQPYPVLREELVRGRWRYVAGMAAMAERPEEVAPWAWLDTPAGIMEVVGPGADQGGPTLMMAGSSAAASWLALLDCWPRGQGVALTPALSRRAG